MSFFFFRRAPRTFVSPLASLPPPCPTQVIALPLPAATFEPELYPERTEVSLTQPVEVSIFVYALGNLWHSLCFALLSLSF